MPQLSARLEAIAHMAPTLKEGELRIAIQLIIQAGESNHTCASVRELAARTRCSTSTVQAALASLLAKNLISQLAGDRKTATVFTLRFAGVKSIGVSETDTRSESTGVAAIATPTPISVEEISTSVPATGTRAAGTDTPGVLGKATGVPGTGTPPPLAEAVKQQLAGAAQQPSRARGSDDFDLDRLIDQITNAHADDCDPQDLAEVRNWTHGYVAKFGRADTKRPPPAILAQLLAIAPAETIVSVVRALHIERIEPGESAGWWVTVAIQRIHGIEPQQLRARREELRKKKPQREGLQHAGEIAAEIARRM